MRSFIIFIIVVSGTTSWAQPNNSSKNVLRSEKGGMVSHVLLNSINTDDGVITTEQLTSVDSIFYEITDVSGEKIKLDIVKYMLVFVPKKGDSHVMTGEGNVIAPYIRKRFEKARSGDRILIGTINVKTLKGTTLKVNKELVVLVK